MEIGIEKFVFFPSERSQKLPLLAKKEPRLRDIAREAIEQCQGDILPEIDFLLSPPAIAPGALILHPLGVALSVIGESPEVAYDLWVGPEGGWSELEMQRYIAGGARSISLGDRILRTETAGVAVGFYLRQG